MPTSLGNPVDMSDYISTSTDRAYQEWKNAQDQMNWAKGQFAKNEGVSDKVVGQALDTSKTFNDQMKSDLGLWNQYGVPGLTSQMNYAMGYTTPERMAANRAGALAGTNITFDAAADMAKRALQGYGVADPSSGKFAGLDAGLAAKRAAAAAGTMTKSDRDTEMMGQSLLDRANARFAVLPGQAANEAGVGMAAGNQAVNTGLATTASGAQTMGTPMQWTNMGDDMIKEWKNAMLAGTSLGLQQNRDVAQQNLEQQKLAQSSSSGIGAALGAGAGILGMVGNFAVPGGGSIGGSLLSSALGGIGKQAKGGKVEKTRFGTSPPVTDVEDENDVEEGEPMQLDDDVDDIEMPAPRWLEDRPVQQAQAGGVIAPFDPEGTGYDERTARLGDAEPEWNDNPAAGEPGMRRPGRDEKTGMNMKGRRHETFDHGVEEDRKQGYGLEMRNGRYYSMPFDPDPRDPLRARRRFAEGGSVDQIVQHVYGTAPQFAAGGDVPDDQMNGMDEPEMVDSPQEEMGEPQAVPPEASPSGGAETDDVHALLNEGEFVIPRDVTSWYGEKFFQNLINKAYKEKQSAQAKPEEGAPNAQQAMALSAPPTYQSAGA